RARTVTPPVFGYAAGRGRAAARNGFQPIDDVVARLAATGYIADRRLATTIFLADRLEKPILAEGPAGVGKTELAKSVAHVLGAELHRLQCYEGLDEAKTLYEWEYAKQLLYTQILRDKIGEVVAAGRGRAPLVRPAPPPP